jgi:hypothetical protein
MCLFIHIYLSFYSLICCVQQTWFLRISKYWNKLVFRDLISNAIEARRKEISSGDMLALTAWLIERNSPALITHVVVSSNLVRIRDQTYFWLFTLDRCLDNLNVSFFYRFYYFIIFNYFSFALDSLFIFSSFQDQEAYFQGWKRSLFGRSEQEPFVHTLSSNLSLEATHADLS